MHHLALETRPFYTDTYGEGWNALHLAIEHRNVFIALSLMNTCPSRAMLPKGSFCKLWVDDGEGKSVYWYLSHSKEPKFQECVEHNEFIGRIDSLVTVMMDFRPVSLKSMLMLMADVEFLDSLQTCFVNYDLYLPSALESLIDHHTHYCQVNNLRMTEQVGWEHIGLDVTGSRYDANECFAG